METLTNLWNRHSLTGLYHDRHTHPVLRSFLIAGVGVMMCVENCTLRELGQASSLLHSQERAAHYILLLW